MKNLKLSILVCFFIPAMSVFADELPKEFAKYSETNSAHVTTNLMFFLSSDRYGGYPATSFNASEMIWFGLWVNPMRATSTNNQISIRYLRLPSSQALNFKLLDERGEEVAKTQYGIANSKPAHPLKSVPERCVDIGPDGARVSGMFRPDDMFVITNKGVYEMQISFRICVQTTNGMPDYNVLQNIKKFPLPPYGIIESQPIRVRVLKN